MGWHERLSLESLGEGQRSAAARSPPTTPSWRLSASSSSTRSPSPSRFRQQRFLRSSAASCSAGSPAHSTHSSPPRSAARALFLAARTAFGGFLRDRAGNMAARLALNFERDAFFYMLVLRLAPFIPFFVVSIAPALFNVRLKTFLAATLVGVCRAPSHTPGSARVSTACFVAARAAGQRCRHFRSDYPRDNRRLSCADACRGARHDCKEGSGTASALTFAALPRRSGSGVG